MGLGPPLARSAQRRATASPVRRNQAPAFLCAPVPVSFSSVVCQLQPQYPNSKWNHIICVRAIMTVPQRLGAPVGVGHMGGHSQATPKGTVRPSERIHADYEAADFQLFIACLGRLKFYCHCGVSKCQKVLMRECERMVSYSHNPLPRQSWQALPLPRHLAMLTENLVQGRAIA